MALSEAIYAKTPASSEEVRSRKVKLAPKLRTMLILVDGRKPVGALRDEVSSCGMPSDCIEQLETLGLVQPLGAPASTQPPAATPGAFSDAFERFRAAQGFMNDTVVN